MKFDLDYTLNVLKDLLAIDSPTGFCKAAGIWSKEQFEKLGIPAEIKQKGGVLAVLPFHLSNFRDKDKKKVKYTYKKLIDEISGYGFTYIEKNLEGIHFEKVYSPYYQQKGGVTFDSLERGKFMSFEK